MKKWTWLTIAIMVLLAVGLAAITSSCRGKKADNSDVIAELRIQVAVMKQQLIDKEKYHQTPQPIIQTIPAQPVPTAPAKTATRKTETGLNYSAITRLFKGPSAEQQLPNRQQRSIVEIQSEMRYLRKEILDTETMLATARVNLRTVGGGETYEITQRGYIKRLIGQLEGMDIDMQRCVAELQQVMPPPQQANVTVKAYVVKVATNGTKTATKEDGSRIVIIHGTNTTAQTQK